jgi:hypothetical protein
MPLNSKCLNYGRGLLAHHGASKIKNMALDGIKKNCATKGSNYLTHLNNIQIKRNFEAFINLLERKISA